ncbi:hypothetical protein CDAR_554771 [Caerostris darwini]|uniref:Uncharacterized protein n=1 Tax=Caerostris darwini TaxID=1538125 RepID=A0AAV4N4Z0_9ARAC|nr:hypothetical protein CDAR_554771 [Caerostris darwini]
MYFAVITLLVLPSSVVLGNHWRFETQGASCPLDENCKYISSCPGAKARFREGDPPTICGWNEALPMVCCSNYAEGVLLLNGTINGNPAPNVNPERNENRRSRNIRFNPRLSSISETGCGRRESLTSYNAGRFPTYYAGGINTIWRWPWMLSI